MQQNERKYYHMSGEHSRILKMAKLNQVQRVVKSKADKKNPPTAYYELANIHEHSNSRRMTELDYEYQPCDEFFILKRGGERNLYGS